MSFPWFTPKCIVFFLLPFQVDASAAQLAHDQAAIDYCFKPALEYKAASISAGQAVLKILTTLREVADSAQVGHLPLAQGLA